MDLVAVEVLVVLEQMHPELQELVVLEVMDPILVQLSLELPILAFMLEVVEQLEMDAELMAQEDQAVVVQDVLQVHQIQVVAVVAVHLEVQESSL